MENVIRVAVSFSEMGRYDGGMGGDELAKWPTDKTDWGKWTMMMSMVDDAFGDASHCNERLGTGRRGTGNLDASGLLSERTSISRGGNFRNYDIIIGKDLLGDLGSGTKGRTLFPKSFPKCLVKTLLKRP